MMKFIVIICIVILLGILNRLQVSGISSSELLVMLDVLQVQIDVIMLSRIVVGMFMVMFRVCIVVRVSMVMVIVVLVMLMVVFSGIDIEQVFLCRFRCLQSCRLIGILVVELWVKNVVMLFLCRQVSISGQGLWWIFRNMISGLIMKVMNSMQLSNIISRWVQFFRVLMLDLVKVEVIRLKMFSGVK